MSYLGQFAGLTRQSIQFKVCEAEKSASAKTQPFWSKWLEFMHQDVCMVQCVDFSHLLQNYHCDHLSICLCLYADLLLHLDYVENHNLDMEVSRMTHSDKVA